MRFFLPFGLAFIAVTTPLFAADVPPSDDHAMANVGLKQQVDSLSSDDFSARQKAMLNIEQTLAQQAMAIAGGATDDDQTKASVAEIMDFNDGVSRWMKSMLAASADERAAELKFAAQPEALPILAKVFSANELSRAAGVAAAAKLDFPGTNELLAQLIDENDRVVSVTAMDAVYDRTPSNPIMGALWRRAVEAGSSHQIQFWTGKLPPVTFRGRRIEGLAVSQNNTSWADGDLATEVLVHYKSPFMKEKLIAHFRNLAAEVSKPDVHDGVLSSLGIYNPTTRNAYTLLEAYKPVETVPSLYALATCRAGNRSVYGGARNEKSYITNRTAPLALLVMMTDQKPEDYHLKIMDQGEGGRFWACSVTDDDAILKLREWWATNGQRYEEPPNGAPTASAAG